MFLADWESARLQGRPLTGLAREFAHHGPNRCVEADPALAVDTVLSPYGNPVGMVRLVDPACPPAALGLTAEDRAILDCLRIGLGTGWPSGCAPPSRFGRASATGRWIWPRRRKPGCWNRGGADDPAEQWLRRQVLGISPEALPPYAEAILRGGKRREYRRAAPRRPVMGLVLYAAAPVGQVVGECRVGAAQEGSPEAIWERTGEEGGLSQAAYARYFAGAARAVAIRCEDPARHP